MKSAGLGRLTAPVMMIIGGAGFTAATAAAYGWVAAIPVAVIAVVAAVGYYLWGARDSDTGAMFGQRADERQSLTRTRAQALALVAGACAGVVGYMVAIALRDPVWPFALIFGVQVIAFIVGLAIYGERGVG